MSLFLLYFTLHYIHSLPQYLLNFALSRIDSGHPEEAVSLMQRGLRILDLHARSETAFERDLRSKLESQMARARGLIHRHEAESSSSAHDEL